MAISYLPPEILTNIFTRLPIETLGNVMLVNKFCLKLIISTPAFARAHLKHSEQGKISSGYRFIFTTMLEWGLMHQFSYESVLLKSCPINVVDLDYPKNELLNPYVWFVGSCDGLVCFTVRKHVLLWNPCTDKYKKLPCLNVDRKRCYHVVYGFGYDDSTEDYKVVAVSLVLNEAFHEVNVWSLKRNSWKRIQDFSGSVTDTQMGKLVNGKIHWFSYYNENRENDIVSFEVGSEIFGIVEQPSNYGVGDMELKLGVLEGCICSFVSYEEQTRVDLWVMKEYGVKESWTKVVTISCFNILNGIRSCSVLPNGEIMFGSFDSLAVYDPKDDSFWFPDLNRLGCYFEPVMYIQSLVSPLV